MGGMKQGVKISPFVLIERRLLDAPEWIQIGHTARDIYIELKRNFNGYNNGQLIASYKFLRRKYHFGYKSISKAIRKLIEFGFIELVRRGELAGLSGKKANMYRLTGKYERIREET